MVEKNLRSREEKLMKNKCIKKVIAVVLVGTLSVVSFLQPLNTQKSEAAAAKEYVKEVVIEKGSSLSEVKDKLTKKGYTPMEKALGSNKGIVTVLGYKKTTKPEEAITDISAMNMNGRYSFSEYQRLLDARKADLNTYIESYEKEIKEYQKNLANKSVYAMQAKIVLNKLREDDSEKLLGDFFEEYNADDKEDKETLEKILLQGSAATVLTIEDLLVKACDVSEKSWLERLSSLGPKGLEKKYREKNISVLEIKRKYADCAVVLREIWNELKKDLEGYVNSTTSVLETDKKVEDFLAINENQTEDEISQTFVKTKEWAANAEIVTFLKSMPYGEKTLYDLFVTDEADVLDSDLYTVADAMSAGQRAGLNKVGLKKLVLCGSIKADLDNTTEEKEEQIECVEKKAEEITKPVSVYDGVDRSYFSKTTALTGKAIDHMQSSKDMNYAPGLVFGVITPIAGIAFLGGLVLGSGLIAISMKICSSIFEKVAKRKAAIAAAKATGSIAEKTGRDLPKLIVSSFRWSDNHLANATTKMEKLEAVFENLAGGFKYSGTSKLEILAIATKAVGIILFVAGIAIGIYDIVNNIIEKNKKQSQKINYLAIPYNMVHMIVDETGKKLYTHYKMVSDLDGNDADITAFKGKQWEVLYASKETDAGAPILANSLEVLDSTDGAAPELVACKNFGEAATENLNAFGEGQKSFLYYMTDKDAYSTNSEVASVFSKGMAAMEISVFAIFSAAITLFVLTRRKKRKNILEK